MVYSWFRWCLRARISLWFPSRCVAIRCCRGDLGDCRSVSVLHVNLRDRQATGPNVENCPHRTKSCSSPDRGVFLDRWGGADDCVARADRSHLPTPRRLPKAARSRSSAGHQLEDARRTRHGQGRKGVSAVRNRNNEGRDRPRLSDGGAVHNLYERPRQCDAVQRDNA